MGRHVVLSHPSPFRHACNGLATVLSAGDGPSAAASIGLQVAPVNRNVIPDGPAVLDCYSYPTTALFQCRTPANSVTTARPGWVFHAGGAPWRGQWIATGLSVRLAQPCEPKGEVEAHASTALEPTQSGEARADSEGGRYMGELCSTRAYKFTTGANAVRRSQLLARSAVRLRHAASESIRVTRRRRSFLASCLGLFCHFDRHCQRRDRGCCRYYHAGSVFCSPLRRLCSIKWRLPLNAVYSTFAALACVEAIPAYKHGFFTESRELMHLMHESAPPLTPLLVVRTRERCYRFRAYRRVFSSLSLWLGQSAACCVQLRCNVS